MSFFRAHRGATVVLFALTLAAVSTKGVCLMPAAVGETADAHACCAKGTATIASGCCMDGPSDPTAATITVRAPAPLPGVATASPMGATSPFVPDPQFVFGTHRHHAPPPKTILRV